MKNLNTAVLELHQKGYSFNQIAKELGISKSKAYRIINEKVDVSNNETISERSVSKSFQNVSEQPERKEKDKRNHAENLKLQVKLRKMELQHEAEMKRLELEEQERIREYDSENNSIKNENLILKTQLENLKNEIEKLKDKTDELEHMRTSVQEDGQSVEEYFDEDDYEDDQEESEPVIDPGIQEEIQELMELIINKDKYYIEDLEKLISCIQRIQSDITDWFEDDGIDETDVYEYQLLDNIIKVIEYYHENFDEYTTFWGSTINLTFEEELFQQMEDYTDKVVED